MIPESWRGRFSPRNPMDEPRPRPAFPDVPANIDLPFAETAARVEAERGALQEALAQLDDRRVRWEL